MGPLLAGAMGAIASPLLAGGAAGAWLVKSNCFWEEKVKMKYCFRKKYKPYYEVIII